MPKVAYTEAERQRIRQQLVSAGLELMAEQGLRAARGRTDMQQGGHIPQFLL